MKDPRYMSARELEDATDRLRVLLDNPERYVVTSARDLAGARSEYASAFRQLEEQRRDPKGLRQMGETRLSWKSGYRYCDGKNRKGQPCGKLVPKGIRFCRWHRDPKGLRR